MKDRDPSVQTPKKCIKAYCLNICTNEKKGRGRIGSKRDVVECFNRECPLHPYRTGMLKARSGPLQAKTKSERIAWLERERYRVTVAERRLAEAEASLARYSEAEEARLKTLLKQREDAIEVVQQSHRGKVEHLQKQIEVLESGLQKQLEVKDALWTSRYNDRLETGRKQIEEKQKVVEVAKENLKERKETVRKMEIRFNEELEAGIWQ